MWQLRFDGPQNEAVNIEIEEEKYIYKHIDIYKYACI